MTEQGKGAHRVVVGVDGSAASKAALDWAVRQATLTGAAVVAVIAWEFPATYGYPVPVSPDLDFEDIARQIVKEAIAGLGEQGPPAGISYQVVEGNAARALLDASAEADLLVIGNRGHGGFVEALLGSTGQYCIHYARCPVVIIRDSVSGS